MKTQSFGRQRSGAGAEGGKSLALRADQHVILKNGQPGTVQFVSAAMKVARVRLADGKVRTVKLTEITPAGNERDDHASPKSARKSGSSRRREVRASGRDDDSLEDDDFGNGFHAGDDIDPEEGFDEHDEFEATDEAGLRELLQALADPGPEGDTESGTESEVEYVGPDDEHEERDEYADHRKRGDDGHDADDDHHGDSDDSGEDADGDTDDDHDEDDDADLDERRKPEIRRTVARAHPVAGQRPVVSDRVTRRAEKAIAGPPKPVSRKDVEKLGRKDPKSGRQIMQPSGSIRQNERLAAQAAPELETRLSRLAARAPGAKFVRLRPQKNPDRLRDKIKDEDKPAETISDYLASQIAADSVEAKDRVIAQLKKHFKVVDVEDSFLKGREEKAGYPSANVQVMLSNGSTAEVQIVPREVQQATEQSHHFYKMGRNARDAGKTALSKHYFDQARAINERALARFRLRNGIRGGRG